MLMYGQMIDREAVIKSSEAQRLRRESKIKEARNIINSDATETAKMLAKADIIESEANIETWEKNLAAAKMELATIKKIMSEIEPYRKYAHLPLLEANEAAQRDEWLGEFKNRVENFLFTTGTIPEDHLRAMRNHPDFETKLLPHIKTVMQKLANAQSSMELLTNHSESFLEDKSNG